MTSGSRHFPEWEIDRKKFGDSENISFRGQLNPKKTRSSSGYQLKVRMIITRRFVLTGTPCDMTVDKLAMKGELCAD